MVTQIVGDELKIILSYLLPSGFEAAGEITPAILTSPRELEGVHVHKGKEQRVSGDEMIARAPEYDANLGFADLKLCLDRQDEIPAYLRGKAIIFSKAIAVDCHQQRYVFYLIWRGNRWGLDYCWLKHKWNRNDVLGRRRKLAA